MKAFVVLAVIVGAAFGAPTEDIDHIHRIKKSYDAAPVALYLSAGPGIFKEDEHKVEEKAEHTLHARSYYGGPASAASAVAALAGAAAAGAAPAAPAIGVFPGAKIGGCAVPLLLSCAPNVHAGHIAHSAYPAAPAYPSVAAIAAPAYRTEGDATKMHDLAPADHSTKMREMVPEKNWSESERATLMRESGPVKSWAESERAAQMMEHGPVRSWSESARGVDHTPIHMQPHHHHHHHNHIDGDIDTDLRALNN